MWDHYACFPVMGELLGAVTQFHLQTGLPEVSCPSAGGKGRMPVAECEGRRAPSSWCHQSKEGKIGAPTTQQCKGQFINSATSSIKLLLTYFGL